MSALKNTVRFIRPTSSMTLIPKLINPKCYQLKCESGIMKRSLSNSTIRTQQAKERENIKEFSEIPGPRSYPIIKNLPSMLFGYDSSKPHLLFEKYFDQYGPLFKMEIPGLPKFVASLNPDDIESLLKATMKNPVRLGFFSMDKVRRETPVFEGKTGLLAENNEAWRNLRKRVQGPLMKPKNVALYLPEVDVATQKFMNRIDYLQKDNGQVPDDFHEELYRWSLECIAFVALNKQLGCLEPDISKDSMPMQLIETVNDVFKALNDTEMNIHWWKFYKTKSYKALEAGHQKLTEIAEQSLSEAMESLKEAQAKGDANRNLTIIETFLQTEGLKRSDILTMVLDMLFAGVDTTSHAVAFTLYLVAKHPEVQKKLQAEIDQVMGDSVDLLPEHIAEMIYLNKVVKESLRLYPLAIGLGRTTTEEIVISGYKVPPNVSVLTMNLLLCRKEKYFQRPNEFIPERWNRDRPLGEIHPFASLPFSHGTRMCIGRRLAEQEIYTFFIRALQKYNITIESNEEMKIKAQFVLKPDIALPFKFHSRN